jgi:hypothetical protein
MFTEMFEVGEHVIELPVADGSIGEGRHRPEAMPDLETDDEFRDALVDQGRAQAAGAADVALIAGLHEDALTLGEAGVHAEPGFGNDVGPSGDRTQSRYVVG